MYEEITPKEHQANCEDCKDSKAISQKEQIMNKEDIRQTSADSQGFLNQTLEGTKNLNLVDEKQGVGCLGQSKVQNLKLQVTEEVLDELLVKTLQY